MQFRKMDCRSVLVTFTDSFLGSRNLVKVKVHTPDRCVASVLYNGKWYELELKNTGKVFQAKVVFPSARETFERLLNALFSEAKASLITEVLVELEEEKVEVPEREGKLSSSAKTRITFDPYSGKMTATVETQSTIPSILYPPTVEKLICEKLMWFFEKIERVMGKREAVSASFDDVREALEYLKDVFGGRVKVKIEVIPLEEKGNGEVK